MLNDDERRELELLRKSTQTIEQTGKAWKGFQLIGCILIIFGIFASFPIGDDVTDTNRALFFFIIGFAMYVIGKFGAWWYHG